jgi:hypothetical protein
MTKGIGIGIDADLATFRMISVLRQRGASWREIGSASGKPPQVAKRDAKRLAARLRRRLADEVISDEPLCGGYFPLEDPPPSGGGASA